MLSAIVDWSIHNRVLTLALAVLLLGLGLRATRHAELDVFPEFAPPQVVIQTEAPGLSPDEVEGLVTLPVETTVNGVSGLETLRSRSVQGLSVVTAIFEDGTDLYLARQQVGERVAEIANQLPQGVGAPRLAPLTPATGRLLTIGFTSKSLSTTVAVQSSRHAPRAVRWTVELVMNAKIKESTSRTARGACLLL